MKRTKFYSIFVAAAYFATITLFTSCEGPEGPAGKDGTNGADGADGNATCGVCHDFSETVNAKMAQYANSQHAKGIPAFEAERNICAPCHSSQGFREVITTGLQQTAAGISDPTQPNCYTCHNIHATYSANDWALRVNTPTARWQGGEAYDRGASNTCAQCHQFRVVNPFPDVNNLTADFSITSKRFGPHHGPQSQLLQGQSGFEIGFAADASHAHYVNNAEGCVTCHMAEAFGTLSGGHQMGIYAEEEDADNLAGCLTAGCHTDAAAVEEDMATLQEEIKGKMDELWLLLVDKGIANPADSTYCKTGTYSNLIAGCYFNWKYMQEDRSFGIHNPTYAGQLLDKSIAALASN
jgi:hypothetical protein